MLRRALIFALLGACSSFGSAADTVDAARDASIPPSDPDAGIEVEPTDGGPLSGPTQLVKLQVAPLGIAALGSLFVVAQPTGLLLFDTSGPSLIVTKGFGEIMPDETVLGPVVFSDSQTVIYTTSKTVRRCQTNVSVCKGSDLKLTGGSKVRPAATSVKLATTKSNGAQMCVLPPCSAMKNIDVSADLGVPSALAFADGFLFIGTGTNVLSSAINGAGDLAMPMPYAAGGAVSMVLDAKALYWADPTGNIDTCTLSAKCASGSAQSLTTLRNKPNDLAVAGNKLYWAEPTGVFRCDLSAACQPEQVAAIANTTHIALGDRIYITTASSIWAAPY